MPNTPSTPPDPDASLPVELQAQAVSADDLAKVYDLEVHLDSIFVPTDKPLPVGSVVSLQIRSAAGLPATKAIARVTHVRESGSLGFARKPGMSLSFLDVRPSVLQDGRSAAHSDRLGAGVAARVLVVDDDRITRAHLTEVLQRGGHEVLGARNGVEALSLALSEQVDLVLTDVNMPTMDGWQLLRLLRARPRLARTPVVFLTRLDSDEERLKGYELGVSDFIGKPVRDAVLVEKVAEHLERGRSALPASALQVLKGDLSQVPLSSLLSLMEMERRSGLLRLQYDNAQALLFVAQGTVVQVDLMDGGSDDLMGRERLLHVLSWSRGEFELNAADISQEDQVGMSVTEALLEHARRLDEAAATS